MHAGLLAQCHDLFQSAVFLQAQCDRDLIQLILRQDHEQVINASQDLDTLIHRAALHMIIQNAAHYISPLWVQTDAVDIRFR